MISVLGRKVFVFQYWNLFSFSFFVLLSFGSFFLLFWELWSLGSASTTLLHWTAKNAKICFFPFFLLPCENTTYISNQCVSIDHFFSKENPSVPSTLLFVKNVDIMKNKSEWIHFSIIFKQLSQMTYFNLR